MARAIWSGSVSFGLVTIPVKLYPATDPQDVQFHQFEKDTGKRIHYKRVAGQGNKEVAYDDIVKGYEASKGEFVIVTPQELESVEPTRTRTIEIEDFVDLDEIDPIYYEKTYFLAPDRNAGAGKPYALLHKAMEQANKVAIGRFVLRTKEYLAAIRPMDGVLALETMFFADEIREAKDVEGLPARASVSKRELDVALQLIDAQAREWDPSRYEDRYRDAVLKVMRAKAKGKEIVVEKGAEPEKVEDLMDALRLSVEQIKKGKPARPAKATAKSSSRGRRTAAKPKSTSKGRKKAA